MLCLYLHSHSDVVVFHASPFIVHGVLVLALDLFCLCIPKVIHDIVFVIGVLCNISSSLLFWMLWKEIDLL